MKNGLCHRLWIFLVLAVSANATNYYVSPTGNDNNSGLSEAEAWESIDKGNVLGVLGPGDTLLILPGTYSVNATIDLNISGTAVAPIIYRGMGGPVIVERGFGYFTLMKLSGDHIYLEGIELQNTLLSGIALTADSCVVRNCSVHGCWANGILITGIGNLIIGSNLYSNGNGGRFEGRANAIIRSLVRNNFTGLSIGPDADNSVISGNTVVRSAYGASIDSRTVGSRVVNNIFSLNSRGIVSPLATLCAYNLFWENTNSNYSGGVVDSVGGLTANPLFVDTATANYTLGPGSPAIDAGINIGYEFNGLAPDIGAFESGELHHLQILPMRDTLSADTTYQFYVMGYDSAGEAASTGTLTWSHTFATGSIESNGLFSPVGVGTGTVSVTSSFNGVSATTGSMYVRPGAPVTVTVVPDTLTIPAGASQLFSASGIDKNANTVTDLGIIAWSITGGVGTIDSTGLFSATKTGVGIITASSSLGLSDVSDTISVIPGPLATLDVLPSTNVVPTLQSYQYSALAHDAFANLIGDFTDSVTWTTTDLNGSITSSALYTAGLVGTYWVKADHLGICDSGSVTVTLGGGLDHIRIEFTDGTAVGDLTLSTDIDTTRLVARGYTAGNVLIGEVSVDWSILGPAAFAQLVPDIGTSAELRLRKTGQTTVTAQHASGLADSTGIITISSGEAAWIRLTPTTGTVTVQNTLRFVSIVRDADMNLVIPPPLVAWSVTGDIGSIDSTGLFTAQAVGQGRIIATSGSVTDTSGIITVNGRTLASLRVVPDSVAVGIGDTVLFSAIGFDSLGNITDPGVITWRALGRAGTIDTSGRYIANVPGTAAVSAFNQLANIGDTAALRVEELYFSTITLGNSSIHPGGDDAAVIAFRIDNYFTTPRTVTSILIRDLSTGAGTTEQLATNMSAARLYADTDGDSLASESDTLLAEVTYDAAGMTFSLPGLEVAADSGMTFIVTAQSAATARDGDTVDVALIPGADIMTADSTVVDGPPLSNSLGVVTIDGMVASQITVEPALQDSVTPADSLQLVLSVNLPRNGYRSDSLTTFSVANAGTATDQDFDSLVLLADDGDGLWEGSANEIPLGRLVYNGEDWSRGGLNCPLINATTRLFVAAQISRFPVDGGTIVMGIPIDGVKVRSTNDGPINKPAFSTDTLIIEGRQTVVASVLAVPSGLCVPGQITRPLLAVQLTNGYTQAIAIDSCQFTFIGIDRQGASASQLASQVDSVYLFLNRDGDASTISMSDSLVSACRLRGEKAGFDVGGLGITGSGGTRTIIVAAKLSLLACKNGNAIGFSLADSSAVTFDRAARVTGSFPLLNPAEFTVDAFPSAAVTVHAVSSGNLYAGQVDQPVLDVEIPRNGYAADRLTSIEIVNSGTLSEVQVLEHVRLWKDATRNGFSIDDAMIGEFTATSDGWKLDNIKAALDSLLNRFIVTVSISGKQFDGGTLRFDLPISGVLTASGMTGPDDADVLNVSSFLIFPSNRVTAISIPAVSAQVSPGSSGLPLMTFALYNGYVGQQKTLNQVTLTNSSRSAGSQSFADHELGQVSLYWDTNENRILDEDQRIGTGLLTNGSLRFDGFVAPLPPESLAYFFVTADLPSDLIDGDSLSAVIARATDFSFSEFVNLNGDLPLSSGGQFVVNGSLRHQYSIHGPSGRSIAPGDSNVVLFAFSPASNGDQLDRLSSLSVTNLGTATSTDISDLSLWLDVNADNHVSSGDSILGLFASDAGTWSILGLGLPVTSTPPDLLIVGEISASAIPSATIRVAVPKLGCLFESGNDGPIDSSLVAPGMFSVSTSGLRVSIGLTRESFSVGQTIDLPLTVTNLSGGPIDSVLGVLAETIGSSLVRLDSSTAGPIDLPVNGSITCHFYFTAVSQGDVVWTLRAVSHTPIDSSILIQSPRVAIQRAISPIAPQLLNTSPTAVTKGQTNIFPMTLGCTHPDTGAAVAAIITQGLRLRVIDGQGAAVPANSVFSRLLMATGYEILSVLATVPAQSDISFTFGNPVMINPGSTQSLMLIGDIAPNASAADFRLSVDSATWIPLLDANTGQIIPNAPTVVYPLRTAPTRIDAPSQQIAVSAVSCALPTVNFGQQNAAILKLRVRHSGQPGSSGAQLTRLSLEVTDSIGNGLPAGDLFTDISAWRQSYLIGESSPTLQDSSVVDIPLSTPLNLNAQELDSIVVAVSVRPSTTVSGFSLRIADSSKFTVRDLNTGSSLLAVSDTTLATGNTFPIQSTWSKIRMAAEPLSICPADIAPSTIVGGADSVQLISLFVSYPTTSQHSSVRLATVNLNIEDGIGNGLDPHQLFDRMGVRVASGAIQYNQDLLVTAGQLRVRLSDTGLVLSAGDSLPLDLVGDLRLEAPYTTFTATIVGRDEFTAYDMSDPTRNIGANAPTGCTQSFPFLTKTTSILLPAGRPVTARTLSSVHIASVGSQGVVIYEGTLTYNSPSPSGQIDIRGLSAQLNRRNSVDPVAPCVSRFHLEIDGIVVGTDSTLVNNRLTVNIPNGVTLSRGESVPVRVICDISVNAAPGNIEMTFTDSTFLTIVDKSLLNPVYAILSGSSYPAAAGEISIVAADLKTSFTNYPNPFNPAHGEVTTIGFNLNESALIDLEVFTITGDLVFRVATQSRRPAGAHQSDMWSGLNGEGQAVVPGVYFCRITATYDSGRVESFRRKIAVLR